MPTGYTSKLYEGEPQAFPEFAMSCARAFGALILMRDDPADAPIPDEFQPSDHHRRELAKARERLAEVQAWTDDEALADLESTRRAAAAARAKAAEKSAAVVERYKTMLDQVDDWQPPTAEHVEFKEFMREQLTESIDFDGGLGDYPHDPEATTGKAWRVDRVNRAMRDVAYHEKEYAKEVERTAGRNAWVKALRDSLEAVPA